jgi:acetylornithine/N-succinyldiaminopimelate aminotransferase
VNAADLLAPAPEHRAEGAVQSALLGVYRPAEPVFVSGSGCRLRDDRGRRYLDFGSGIGVNALGYGDAGVARALARGAASGLIHTSNLFRTTAAPALAQELVRHSFADRVFFCNSGAEANEAAFKFARRWAREQSGAPAGAVPNGDAAQCAAANGAAAPRTATHGGAASTDVGTDRYEIVALRGAFHGRLFGALAATDRPSMREPFEPLMPGVRFIEAEDASAAALAIGPATAAVIVEPVQGEGGVRVLSADYLSLLRGCADRAGALLIFDEVQCGLGRTGHLFACESSGVLPDILTLAKPLAGGLPMGAVLLTERVAKAIRPGDHATTFGGGPLVAGVALEVLRRIADADFLASVRARGAHLQRRLAELVPLPAVAEVRGTGLMWGIELSVPAAPVVERALGDGLILTLAGDRVIRLLPPLVITDDLIDEGVDMLRALLQ